MSNSIMSLKLEIKTSMLNVTSACPTGWILVRRACEQNSTCEEISQQNRVAAVCMVARLCA